MMYPSFFGCRVTVQAQTDCRCCPKPTRVKSAFLPPAQITVQDVGWVEPAMFEQTLGQAHRHADRLPFLSPAARPSNTPRQRSTLLSVFAMIPPRRVASLNC